MASIKERLVNEKRNLPEENIHGLPSQNGPPHSGKPHHESRLQPMITHNHGVSFQDLLPPAVDVDKPALSHAPLSFNHPFESSPEFSCDIIPEGDLPNP